MVRADDQLKKLKPNYLNEDFNDKFASQFERLSEFIELKSTKDLAESLRTYNKNLHDKMFVFCEDSSLPEMDKATRLLRSQSRNPVMVVRDKKLAGELRMEPGIFYCYYKPSYINGYSPMQDQDIDYSYLQAFEGICRDEFHPIPDAFSSDFFQNKLMDNKGLYTHQFNSEVIDTCFKRSYFVSHMFNTDMRDFKAKYKYGKNATKPIIFILWTEMFMSNFAPDFQGVLRNYNEMFDVYFCSDEKKAAEFFNV